MATNLFAGSAASGGGTSFRAGKMVKEGGMVKPDKRKGLVSVTQQGGLTRLIWKDRSTNVEEDSWVLMPGEATYTKVEKCTTGRVYLLDFKQSGQQVFFWMQEPKADKDEEYAKAIRSKVAAPGTQAPTSSGAAGTANAGAAGSGGVSGLQMSMLEGILSNLQQGGTGASGGPTPAPPAAGRQGAEATGLNMRALQQQQGFRPPDDDVDLQDLLASSELREALQSDPEFYQSRIASLLPPQSSAVSDDVVENACNPQVSATGALLQAALSEMDGFREITNAFGLTGAENQIGSNAFLKRLEDEAKKKRDK